MSAGHAFGGDSTDLKLSVVEDYLTAFTTALRSKFSDLWYIDAFAGTGERTVVHEASEGDMFEPAAGERLEQRRGSARIAIDTQPHFDRLIFMDILPAHCDALRQLRAEHKMRQIDVIQGDANKEIG